MSTAPLPVMPPLRRLKTSPAIHDTTLVLCATNETFDSKKAVRWRNAFSTEYRLATDASKVVYIGEKLTLDHPNVCIHGKVGMLQKDDPVFAEIAKHAPYSVLIDEHCPRAKWGVTEEIFTHLVDTFVIGGYVIKSKDQRDIAGFRHIAYAQIEDTTRSGFVYTKELELVQYG